MSKIVGIGANVCDTLITVPNYPKEDTKLKADSIVQCGGGPCATGLVAASKLGEKCAYIGTLTDDSAGKFLVNDLEKYGVKSVTPLYPTKLPFEFNFENGKLSVTFPADNTARLFKYFP